MSEESQILLRILNGSFQTLDVIKDRIVHAFADLFCSKANLDVIGMRFNCSITYSFVFQLILFAEKLIILVFYVQTR